MTRTAIEWARFTGVDVGPAQAKGFASREYEPHDREEGR
jgi:hypothetical protein